jgi:hypothetical protein
VVKQALKNRPRIEPFTNKRTKASAVSYSSIREKLFLSLSKDSWMVTSPSGSGQELKRAAHAGMVKPSKRESLLYSPERLRPCPLSAPIDENGKHSARALTALSLLLCLGLHP